MKRIRLHFRSIFYPELVTSLKSYSFRQLTTDLMSGTIVGFVALPLALAFAIASGVSPEKGLITAVIAGFLISSLGGSKVQIGGPTGAFVVIVYEIIHEYGMSGLLVATVMAGVILIVMGISGLGSVIKYIPHPVTVGFTGGIAVIIFSTQVKDLLGLHYTESSSHFLEKWYSIFVHLPSIDPINASISALAILIILLWPRISRKIPGPLVAIIVTTLLVALFKLPVDTIGQRFGEIPSALPSPSFEMPDLAGIRKLITPATTIALLGAIESLLSAVVADGMIGARHRSNTELIAQGVANIVTPLFGGIPATGAIARTATNVKNGGRTPISGMVHAVVLFLIMIFLGRYAALIPMATLAGILVVVSYNMSEWRSFVGILKSPRSDVAVLLTTFFLTVIFDLTVAIQIGMLLAVLLFIRRVSQTAGVKVITSEDGAASRFVELPVMDDDSEDPFSIRTRTVPPNVEVYEIEGPFFFGTAGIFQNAIRAVSEPPGVRIVRMRKVPAIDATGMHMLEKFIRDSRKQRVKILLSGVRMQPMLAMRKSGLVEEIGEENIHDNIDIALKHASELVAIR